MRGSEARARGVRGRLHFTCLAYRFDRESLTMPTVLPYDLRLHGNREGTPTMLRADVMLVPCNATRLWDGVRPIRQ